ncbi:hypothetical protein [Clostridium vincentii]|uniref:DUF5105 domain-containing protein n=1 Tax=Clostridium vincentii TaxID=52704 RepID=A0A2T0BJI4_9CLOT|nr:hypothetical protein [Clostridium vincentii]PRR84058.1 hypothetical protein CLVI_03560 [Clostridium vincentii]
MKKSKKLITVLMTAILGSALFLTGCAGKPAAADVTVKAFYNLYILGDSTDIEKIALTKEEVAEKFEEVKTLTQSEIKANFAAGGLSISDDQLDAIYNSEMEALKKLTVTTEIVSEDDEKATVKLTTTYFDITAIDIKAATETSDEVSAMQLTSQSELDNKIVEIYSNKLVEGFKSAEPSTETKEEYFECVKTTYSVNGKNKDIYTPEDMEKFTTDINMMVTNQQ